MSTVHLILFVLLTVAVAAGTESFLVLPLAIEWLSLVTAGIYLLVRKSRARGAPPSHLSALITFTLEFILSLVTAVAVTQRAPGSTLCEDFGKIPNPCRVALAVVALSWLAATTAFAGILLPCADPLYRLYLALRSRRRTSKPTTSENHIELAYLPTPATHVYNAQGANSESEIWSEISIK
ncbi:hypothetical protein C8R47DRAFT_1207190 [Mycena vitilis]|nr:hypothetical protein C8R47DRAFT_1207190 [Mycena vitilis]